MIVWFHEGGHAMDYNGYGKNTYSSDTRLQRYILQDFRNIIYRLANDQEITKCIGDVLPGSNPIYTKEQKDIIAECIMDYNRGDCAKYNRDFTAKLSSAQIAAGQNWNTAYVHVCSELQTKIQISRASAVSGDSNAFAVGDALIGLTYNHPNIGESHIQPLNKDGTRPNYWKDKNREPYGAVHEFVAEYFSSKITKAGASVTARDENERFFGNATSQMNLMEVEMLDRYVAIEYKHIDASGGFSE